MSSKYIYKDLYIYRNICPGGQLGPNRQEVQFSEFIDTTFASYMQSIPKETTTSIWFTQSYKVCNSTTMLQEVQML